MNTSALPDSTGGSANLARTSSPVSMCGETGQDASARNPATLRAAVQRQAPSDPGGSGSPFNRALITADTYLAPLNSPVLATDTDVARLSAATAAAFKRLPQPFPSAGDLPLSPTISKTGEARPSRRTSTVRFSPYVAVKTYSLEEGRAVTRSVKAFWEGYRKQKKLKKFQKKIESEQKRVQDQLAELREQLLRAEEKRALQRKSRDQKRKRE